MQKTAKKIDLFLWAFIWLLPFFAFFVSWYRAGSAPSLFTFINDQFAFTYLKDVFDKVWQAVFDCSLPLSGYLSYLICVEIAHVLFDALVFIPRFAHDLLDKFERGDFVCRKK